MEIERQGKTYTYETVERLQKEYPDSELYFIMGADCLFSIENWREPQRIFQGCKVIAAARNGSSLDRMKEKQKELMTRFHADILLLSFPAVDISSTEIRRRVLKGESVRYMVPDEVNDNILKYHLYQSEVQ